VKTAKYRKRCFDQIQGISEDNKELTAEVDRLRKLLETAEKDQAEAESQRLNAVLQLGQKERERTGNLPYPCAHKHWKNTIGMYLCVLWSLL
jgi:regulator of replication initiation timing